MTLTDQQRREAVLRLASLKCPTCNGTGQANTSTLIAVIPGTRPICPDCQGTGGRLPGLRTLCISDFCDAGITTEDDLPWSRKGQPHRWCGGRGWNPIGWYNERELRLALPQIGLKPAYEPDSGMWLVRWLDGDGWLHSAPSSELIDAIPSTEIIDAIAEVYELEGVEE